jgi:4-amino-4-deoxy-L-arabinose transferase-like glycosyltransferase
MMLGVRINGGAMAATIAGVEESPRGPRTVWIALLLIVLVSAAFAVRFIYVRSLSQDPYWPDAREYHVIALEMQHGWAYRNAAGQAIVYWPPGYPYFVAATYRALGPIVHSARVCQAALGALTCVLIYLIGARLFDRRCGLLAAAFAAIYPLAVYTAGTLYPATLQTFLLACVVLFCLIARDRGSAWLAVIAGIVAAALSLVTPSALPAFALAALWLAWPIRSRRPILMALLFLLPVLLALAGWSYRNYRSFGRSVAVSANGGFNFWLGNHPDVTATTGNRMTNRMRLELGSVYARHRNVAVRDSVLFSIGVEYIKADPRRFVRLSAAKAANFWRLYPKPMTDAGAAAQKAKLYSLLSYGVLLPFAVIWLLRSLGRSRGAWLILLVFLAYTGVHALFISKVRFRIPLDPYILIFAAGALFALYDFVRARSARSRG